uniref:Uncharacterized protein n=1 Tax=Romanomermis culicivorax TaxID=13658 RepID=A0A915I758_ROMCU
MNQSSKRGRPIRNLYGFKPLRSCKEVSSPSGLTCRLTITWSNGAICIILKKIFIYFLQMLYEYHHDWWIHM